MSKAEGQRRLESIGATPSMLAAAGISCVLVGLLYFFANIDLGERPNYSDYPFGADVPTYLLGDGNIDLHWLTTKILRAYRALLGVLGIEETALWAKAPYMLFGVANLVLCMGVFAIATGRLSVRSLIYAITAGLALTIIHFSSLPESYALSTALYSAYILGLVYMAARGASARLTLGMGFIFLLGLYNDISILFLTIAPAIMFGLRLVKEPSGRLFVLVHALALAAFFCTRSYAWICCRII